MRVMRCIGVALLIGFSWTVDAQILYCLERKQNAVSLSNGVNKNEPFFTGSIARGFHINIFNILKDDITLFVDLSDRFNFHSDNAFRFTYGGQGNLVGKGRFKLPFRKTFTVTRHKAEEFHATYIGAEFELMPGLYTPKYFIALDFYYGDNYRGLVASNGKTGQVLNDVGTGWFKPRLANFKTGVNAGYHLHPNLCLYGNIDFFIIRPREQDAVYYSDFPLFYGLLGMNYLF